MKVRTGLSLFIIVATAVASAVAVYDFVRSRMDPDSWDQDPAPHGDVRWH